MYIHMYRHDRWIGRKISICTCVHIKMFACLLLTFSQRLPAHQRLEANRPILAMAKTPNKGINIGVEGIYSIMSEWLLASAEGVLTLAHIRNTRRRCLGTKTLGGAGDTPDAQALFALASLPAP